MMDQNRRGFEKIEYGSLSTLQPGPVYRLLKSSFGQFYNESGEIRKTS